MTRDELFEWANSDSTRMPQGSYALNDLYRVKLAIKRLVKELQANGTFPTAKPNPFPRDRGRDLDAGSDANGREI